MASRRCTYKGIAFDSLAEAGYFIDLLGQEKEGLISDIELQPSWDLYAAAPFTLEILENLTYPILKIGKYTADFRYLDLERDEFTVIDVKGQVPGTRTLKNGTKRRTSGGQGWTAFRLRCKILEANYGVIVQVVPGAVYTELAKKAGVK